MYDSDQASFRIVYFNKWFGCVDERENQAILLTIIVDFNQIYVEHL